MDPFKLRPLGRSGISLPQLGFGGAPLGELFTKVSEADAEATLAAAWDAGVRYYDTSPWYGLGQSEHRLGRFLYRQPRNEVLLSTKVGRLLTAPVSPRDSESRGTAVAWSGGLKFEYHFDYGYDARHAVLRGQPAAPRHDAGRHPCHPRPRFLASRVGTTGRRLSRPARYRRLSGAHRTEGSRADRRDRRGHQRARDDPALRRIVRPRFLPAGAPLHPRRTFGAGARAAALHRTRHRCDHRRGLQLGPLRHRPDSRRALQLSPGNAGGSRAGRSASKPSANATASRSPPPPSSSRSTIRWSRR